MFFVDIIKLSYNGLSSLGEIFTNAALLALAGIFTIEKFTTLSSRNQHFMKIYESFEVVSHNYSYIVTMHDRDL